MKYQELKDKKTDIHKFLLEKKEELRILRSNMSGSGKKNVKATKGIKKDIARILTLVNESKVK